MVRKYPNATTKEIFRPPNNTCWDTDPNAFRMLREANDDYMPWPGFLLGQTPGSIWYWCADQVSCEPSMLNIIDPRFIMFYRYTTRFSQ